MKVNVVSRKHILMIIGTKSCLWFRNGKLGVSKDPDPNTIKETDNIFFGRNIIERIFIHSKLMQRVLRLQPRACIETKDGRFCFAFNKTIFISDKNGKIINHALVNKGMRNPLNITEIDNVEGFNNSIVYGEYGWNSNRGPVNIMQFDGKDWNIAYTFKENTICHIHNIIADQFNRCVYILTGDNNQESGIWKATDNFHTVVPLQIGKQSDRACVAYLNQNEILYATDTPLEKNHLLALNLVNNQHRVDYDFPGPVVYSTVIGESWWLSTTVEQDPRLPFFIHCISSKLAPGIENAFSYIYKYDVTGRKIEEVAKLKKDRLPMWLFQFGYSLFVNNYRDNRVFLTPIAVKKYSQKTVELIEAS